ncbi:MAG: hypothetical protein JO370_15565 [Paucibacter sp.]|nr:hypothetical protein [Roseateles sp.]
MNNLNYPQACGPRALPAPPNRRTLRPNPNRLQAVFPDLITDIKRMQTDALKGAPAGWSRATWAAWQGACRQGAHVWSDMEN